MALNNLEKRVLADLLKKVEQAKNAVVHYVDALYPGGTKVEYTVGKGVAHGTVMRPPMPDHPTTVMVMNRRTEKITKVSAYKLNRIDEFPEDDQ